jgi:hypothetical protein
MQIKNIDNLSVSQVKELVNKGGKFVIFPYTISFVIMSLKRSSNIYFIRSDENSLPYSYPFVLLNFFIGWWSIPWGPIHTIGSLYAHIKGGKDITQLVLSELIQNDPDSDTSTYHINQGSNQTYNIPTN